MTDKTMTREPFDRGILGPECIIKELAKAERPAPQLVDREAPIALDVPTLPHAEEATLWPAVWLGLASLAFAVAGGSLVLAMMGVW